MGLVAAEEEGSSVHAEAMGTDGTAGTGANESNGSISRQNSHLADSAPSPSSETGLARHLNGLKINIESGSANGAPSANGPSFSPQPLPMGYGSDARQLGGHFPNGGGQYPVGVYHEHASPGGYPGPMHMMPMPLVIPPSPAETLHLPMTLSSPLNLDPNAREFTPSPSPSPSGVVGLPMPPPFSMGPGFDPSMMYGAMPEMGHAFFGPNGEMGGQFYNQSQYSSPGSGSPSPPGWETRIMHEGDRGVNPGQGSPPGREHVSRALLISGVDPHIDDGLLKEELAQWGPVRALDLERKPEGVVTVNYFDLRHAKEALHEIQQQHLKHQREMQDMLQEGPAAEKGRRLKGKGSPSSNVVGSGDEARAGGRGMISGRAVWAQYTLPGGLTGPDAHNQGTLVVFNLDLDMPVEELRKAFEKYGDVKELRETPSKRQHKFVEFFDVRAAALALQNLDGMELGGKLVKIEFSRPGGQARRAQAARSQPGGVNQPLKPPPLNGGNPMFGVVGWEGVMPNPPGGFAPNGMVPPWFMFMPAFPGGPMEPQIVPGLQFPGGPFPMPPFPPMMPPFGVPDHMGRLSGFPRGPMSGFLDNQGFRGRGMDAKRMGKGFQDGRDDEYMHGGTLRRPKDGSRDAPRAQYTFSEFEAELQRENPRTTLMIKNIPNKYSQAMLLALLDAHCVRCNSKIPPGRNDPPSAYDFVYLPIDFKNRCNLGYAFVNFTSPQATLNLYKEFHAQQWEAFNSRKVCQVTYARVQGRKALEDHFRNSRFACDTDEYLPLVFNPPRDGTVCSPPIVAAGHLAGKIASCAGAVSAVAQAHGIDGGSLKGPRIGLVQH